jgi:hypothetical protein
MKRGGATALWYYIELVIFISFNLYVNKIIIFRTKFIVINQNLIIFCLTW